jgi:hypothetical protein
MFHVYFVQIFHLQMFTGRSVTETGQAVTGAIQAAVQGEGSSPKNAHVFDATDDEDDDDDDDDDDYHI